MGFTVPTIFTAIDKMTAPIEKMIQSIGLIGQEGEGSMARVDRRFGKLSDAAANFSKKAAILGAAIIGPLVLAGNEAIKFEDKLADVGKTTQLSGEKLENLGNGLLSLDTRTNIDDRLKISELGGQLGVANTELLDFTKSANKFNVAIGSDFSGGVEEAVTSVSKIKTLFKETQSINIAEAINKTGSAINELGAKGSGTSANIAEFALRMGQLPGALRPSIQDTLALGTFLEESGLDAQVASGGLTRFFLVAGESIGKFAIQMHRSTDEAKNLLATDPTRFAKEFAVSLKGLKPDQLAKTLGNLGIGTQETIKVLGALGTNINRVGELQEISNQAFAAGTSLSEEYAKKEDTTAAKMQRAQNNFQALAIIIGTQLLPVISDLLGYFTPILQSLVAWVKENPGLTKGIVIATLAIGAFVLGVSLISGIVALAAEAVLAWSAITKAYVAIQWALNAAMTANPIGLVIVAIVALIAVVALIITYYDQWGASLTYLLGPLGLVINLIMAFKRNWDLISESFKNGGFLQGIKAIGAVILDSILMPLQQVLGIIGKVTNSEWAINAANDLSRFRKDLTDGIAIENGAAINPQAEKQKNYVELIDKKQQNINMTINDKTGRATMESDNNIFMPKLSTTQ